MVSVGSSARALGARQPRQDAGADVIATSVQQHAAQRSGWDGYGGPVCRPKFADDSTSPGFPNGAHG